MSTLAHRRLLILRIVICLFACTLLSGQEPAASPGTLLQHAIALHKAGDLEGAIRAYREYLAAEPDSVQARSNLGAALAGTSRYDEAIAEYAYALQQSPNNPALLLNSGLAYFKMGRHAEAAARFERAVSLSPQFKEQVTLLLAACYNNLGRYKEAVALLGPLEKDKAGDPGFDFLYGTALIGDGNTVSGTAVIDRILSHGDSAEARLLRGTLELSAHERDSARADLEKAIALNPRLSGAHARLGELLLSQGESDQARSAFTQELALDPDEFTSNLNMGVLAKQDQNYTEALSYFDRALKTRPNDPGIRYQIANVDLATGNLDQARKSMEALIAESPDFAEAHATLATVYYRLHRSADGDRERAISQKLMDQRDALITGGRPR
ncbi:MAG: tetratricopeptide repeat protein [Bryobacteraceae bacterium]